MQERVWNNSRSGLFSGAMPQAKTAVCGGMVMDLDSGILLFIQEFIRNPVLTPFFRFITSLGNAGAIWIVISVILLIPGRTRKVGCMCICAMLFSLLINNIILKNLVQRVRPYEMVSGLTRLIAEQADYSFPSGHTGCSFAAACILYRKLPRKYGITAMALAVLISFSRLYLGVHYPSDVLFGMISGIIFSYGAEILIDYFAKKLIIIRRVN